MLTKYQKLQQLKLIKKLIINKYDQPKIESIDYAIQLVEKDINNSEPCVFDLGMTCSALTSKQCIGCSFRCSKKEHEHDQLKVKNRLEKLGVRVQRTKIDGKEIYSCFQLDKPEKKLYN